LRAADVAASICDAFWDDDAGFRHVEVRPTPGPLTKITSSTPHPRGRDVVDFDCADRNSAIVELPPHTTGTFHWNDKTIDLKGGGRTEVPLG